MILITSCGVKSHELDKEGGTLGFYFHSPFSYVYWLTSSYVGENTRKKKLNYRRKFYLIISNYTFIFIANENLFAVNKPWFETNVYLVRIKEFEDQQNQVQNE